MSNSPETPTLTGAIAAIEKRNGVGLILTPHGELAKLERELGAAECVLRIETQPDLLEACNDAIGYFKAILEISAFVGEQKAVESKIDKLASAIAKAEAQP